MRSFVPEHFNGQVKNEDQGGCDGNDPRRRQGCMVAVATKQRNDYCHGHPDGDNDVDPPFIRFSQDKQGDTIGHPPQPWPKGVHVHPVDNNKVQQHIGQNCIGLCYSAYYICGDSVRAECERERQCERHYKGLRQQLCQDVRKNDH